MDSSKPTYLVLCNECGRPYKSTSPRRNQYCKDCRADRAKQAMQLYKQLRREAKKRAVDSAAAERKCRSSYSHAHLMALTAPKFSVVVSRIITGSLRYNTIRRSESE